MTPTGDYRFGNGQGDFLIDTPACVAQLVDTRLLLMTGEWFLDKTEGTPWSTEILGAHTKPFYDLAIQARVLGTPGVVSIIDYRSNLDTRTRALTVTMRVQTTFSTTPIDIVETI